MRAAIHAMVFAVALAAIAAFVSNGPSVSHGSSFSSTSAASSASQFVSVYSSTANQAVLNNTYTIVAFNQEAITATGSALSHDNATNNSRITCNTAGYVRFTINVAWDGNATGVRIATLKKNGATGYYGVEGPSGTTDANIQSFHILQKVAAGDYFEVNVYQTCGATRQVLGGDATATYFSAEWSQ